MVCVRAHLFNLACFNDRKLPVLYPLLLKRCQEVLIVNIRRGSRSLREIGFTSSTVGMPCSAWKNLTVPYDMKILESAAPTQPHWSASFFDISPLQSSWNVWLFFSYFFDTLFWASHTGSDIAVAKSLLCLWKVSVCDNYNSRWVIAAIGLWSLTVFSICSHRHGRFSSNHRCNKEANKIQVL